MRISHWVLGVAGMALCVTGMIPVQGCGATEVATAPVPSTPPWLAPVAPASATEPPRPEVEPVPSTAVNPALAIFDPSRIVSVLDTPRLAEIKQALEAEAPRRAADGLERALSESPPEGAEQGAWSYQLGLLRTQAGEPMAAVRAFDAAAGSGFVLADYARWLAADLLVQIGEPEAALERLEAMTTKIAAQDDVELVHAAALGAAGEVAAAGTIWSSFLERSERPSGWQNIALRYARVLLNHPSLDHAERAVEVARMVVYESRGGVGVGEARELERRALLSLPTERRTRFEQPELGDLAARARELADARQAREAMAAAEALIKKLPDDKPSEPSCEAYIALGTGLSLVRRYAEASDALGTAIERCEGHPRLVHALFVGARASLRGGQLAEARRRYELIERRFPEHSFADDARLHGAEAARELGDEAAFTAMLSRIAEDYPQGDMVDDGLFALAEARMDQGDWAGAIVPLERAVALQARGRPYWAEGRPQYFLARARLEVGQHEQGKALLAQVIRDFPLTFYMGLAHARLRSLDAGLADRIVVDALASEPVGSFVIPDHEALHRPEFVRAVELVRQGEGELAAAELAALGVGDGSADPNVLWASAFLLARIEAPAESHGLLRASPGIWMQHYPAGVWRPIWEIAFPRPYAAIVQPQAARFGVPQHLAYAIMREESAFRPRAVSTSSAYGLMQLILPTARTQGSKIGLSVSAATLKRPEVNVPLGCRYLSVLMARFGAAPVLAIPGYNAGPGAPERWLRSRPADDFDLFVERIPYRETRHYTKRVIGSMLAYAMLYGDGMQSPLTLLPLSVEPDGASTAAAAAGR